MSHPRGDLPDSQNAAAWVPEAEQALGPLDVLINNAGVDHSGPTLELDLDDTIGMMHLNLLAPLTLTRIVAPQMIARGRGTVINSASIAATAPVPMKAWYAASKAGCAMFSEVLHYEIAGSPVHVMTVYPGPVKTPMSDISYEVMGGRDGFAGLFPEGDAGELARLICKGAKRKKARIIYPSFYAGQYYAPKISGFFAGTFGPKPRF